MKIVLMSDPRVAAIPVQDCGEELIDIRASGLFLVDQGKQDSDGHFAHLRHGLIERLCRATAPLEETRRDCASCSLIRAHGR